MRKIWRQGVFVAGVGVMNAPLEDGSPSRPGLLSSDEYKKRFEETVTSIKKSFLFVIALVAFWMTIEGGYSRYLEIERKDLKIQRLDLGQKEIQKLRDQRKREISLGRGRDRDKAIVEEKNDEIDNIRNEKSQLKEEIKKLKEEKMSLTILGTNLPASLTLAPLFWIMSYICWILYFGAARSAAHRQLSALHHSLAKDHRSFGLVGETGGWIAPLPLEVSLDEHSRMATSTIDLRWLLGWGTVTEQRYRIGIMLFVGIAIAVVARLMHIGVDVTSDFAVRAELSSSLWSTVAAVALIFLGAGAIMATLGLALRSALARPLSGSILASRREFVGLALAATIAIPIAAWRLSGWFPVGKTEGVRKPDAATRRTTALRSPRHKSAEKRQSRLKNYRVVEAVAKPDVLLVSEYSAQPRRRAKSSRSVHFPDENGNVRFYSKITRVDQLVEISDKAAVAAALRAPEAKFEINSFAPTVVWEVAALNRLKAGRVDLACDLLFAGASLTLRGFGRPNKRLFDLLAGLALRYEHGSAYLDRLNVLSKDKRLFRDSDNWLKRRVDKWGDTGSKWYRRWSSRDQPVRWHHPTEYASEETSAQPTAKKAQEIRRRDASYKQVLTEIP